MPGFPVFHCLPESVQTHVHWVTDVILCCSLFLLPLTFPSMRVFFNESALHIRWPKYWNFSFSISHSNEYSGLISIRTNWFDFFAVQGTLKSLLQQEKFKVSILWRSVFFMYLTSIHDYWKNHSFDYTDLSCKSDVSAISYNIYWFCFSREP